MVEHIYVKFGDPSCIGFWNIVWKTDSQLDRQTDAQTNTAENPTLVTTVGVRNKAHNTLQS